MTMLCVVWRGNCQGENETILEVFSLFCYQKFSIIHHQHIYKIYSTSFSTSFNYHDKK